MQCICILCSDDIAHWRDWREIVGDGSVAVPGECCWSSSLLVDAADPSWRHSGHDGQDEWTLVIRPVGLATAMWPCPLIKRRWHTKNRKHLRRKEGRKAAVSQTNLNFSVKLTMLQMHKRFLSCFLYTFQCGARGSANQFHLPLRRLLCDPYLLSIFRFIYLHRLWMHQVVCSAFSFVDLHYNNCIICTRETFHAISYFLDCYRNLLDFCEQKPLVWLTHWQYRIVALVRCTGVSWRSLFSFYNEYNDYDLWRKETRDKDRSTGWPKK